MAKFINKGISFLLPILLLFSCEKVVLEDGGTAQGNLHISAKIVDQIPFDAKSATRSAVPLYELCSRVSFVLYQDGERVNYVNQKTDDDDFGNAVMNIAEGRYSLVVIGHSCATNATTTNINKITFSGKLTDTFVFCKDIEVNEEAKTIEATLTRAVAMVRFVVTDGIPDDAVQLKFYYTGGSSSLDAVTKLGCVESRQTEYRYVDESNGVYEIYTFPHATEDVLQVKISALDSGENVLAEQTIEDIPVTVNMITRISGDLFDGSASTKKFDVSIVADNEWDGVVDYPVK
ncbi:MAG: FimB/Mfa2 family fimbrial subunit [Prevotella sp.]